MPVSTLLTPEEARESDSRLARVRAGEEVPPVREAEIVRKDGSRLWVEITATNVLKEGRVVGRLTLVHDLSETKRLEEQLRQSQKMEAIGHLAGGVAHDFNNLLTVIGGRALLALERSRHDPGLQPALELIARTADRAAALTGQLLAFSRRQILQPRVLDVNTVLAGVEPILRRTIGEDIDLVIRSDPAVGRVRADPGQLEQVILNLSVNARDAMPEGGQLTLETANVVLDETYARHHPDVQPGSYVLLAVSDTGIGMDAATRARLFEPFFTTKETGKGTGLGLSTVYGIVKQSGGHIDVYSEPGQGAAFKVYLPRADAAPQPVEAPVEGASPRGSETVLLVEDEEGLRTLAREILELQGYTLIEASNPGEALARLEAHHGPIHLLVTDVVMPQMSGRELASRVAAARPETRILYMSGYTDDAIIRHGVLDPGTPFLQKPFAPDSLARKVRDALDARGPGPTDSRNRGAAPR
jgi:signal transduction histidine kinase/ActR/RegA family two-component response regulator